MVFESKGQILNQSENFLKCTLYCFFTHCRHQVMVPTRKPIKMNEMYFDYGILPFFPTISDYRDLGTITNYEIGFQPLYKVLLGSKLTMDRV